MEALAFVLILIIFGYFSYPLILWFGFIGVYSLIFFDTNILFWVIFAILAVTFITVSYTHLTLPTKRIV